MCKQGLIDPKKTALHAKLAGAVFTKVVELTAIPWPSSTWSAADVTTLDDIAKRLADAGVIDNGTLEITGLTISGSEQQNQLFIAHKNQQCIEFKIVLSDELETTIAFDAYITTFGRPIQTGDKMRLTFTLTIDGDVTLSTTDGQIYPEP